MTTGVMVALPVPARIAAALARFPDGEPGEDPAEFHVTLAYLPVAPPERDAALVQLVRRFVAGRPPVEGLLSGLARFSGPEPAAGLAGADPLVVLVDAPGLAALRTDLVRELEGAGWAIALEHDFQAHITVRKLPTGEPTPALRIARTLVAFDAAVVARGGLWTVVPFGGPTLRSYAERLRASVDVRYRLRAAAEAADPALTLAPQLAALADAGSPAVNAILARYRAGELTLAMALAQAQAELDRQTDDELGDANEPRKQHRVLALALTGGALAGVALAGYASGVLNQRQTESVLRTSTTHAAGSGRLAASAESGAPVAVAATRSSVAGLDERVLVVVDKLNAGDLSGPQAAAQVKSIVNNAYWSEYQAARNDDARDGDATVGYWERDPTAQGCDDCLALEAGSPYPVDELPTLPGAGDTACGPGCKCNVRYE